MRATLAVALLASVAFAPVARAGVPVSTPSGVVPGQALYCPSPDGSYVPCGTGGTALRASDPSNASFAASVGLTPSGAAGTAGTIGGAAANLTNTGRSFGWNCASAGLGSVTLVDGSVRQVWMYTNSGADVRGDSFAIIDAEPPSGVACTFQVYR